MRAMKTLGLLSLLTNRVRNSTTCLNVIHINAICKRCGLLYYINTIKLSIL